MKLFLWEKNKRYGDSALNPINTFCKIGSHGKNTEIKLLVRMDDKITRIQNSNEIRKNDIVDLMGYMVLLCINKEWMDFNDLID